jgi:hypothetical protein
VPRVEVVYDREKQTTALEDIEKNELSTYMAVSRTLLIKMNPTSFHTVCTIRL